MPRFGPKPLPAEILNTGSIMYNNGIGGGWVSVPLSQYALTASYIPTIVTADGIQGNGTVEEPVQLKSSFSVTSITASFNGNGSAITNITSSNINNFTADVRSKLSGSQYVNYNDNSGSIQLVYTGSVIGNTPIILGQTTTSLSGITNISCSAITASNSLIANSIDTGLVVQRPSAVQNLTASSMIMPDAAVLKIASSGNITLTHAPTIKIDGIAEGTRILICNIGTHIITFKNQDGTNTALQLSSNSVPVGQYGVIELILINDGTSTYWYEISNK
jgi:hypothetical protein